MVKSSVDRYGSISQLLHWCTAIVVLIASLDDGTGRLIKRTSQ